MNFGGTLLKAYHELVKVASISDINIPSATLNRSFREHLWRTKMK